jgi:DNA-binding CsgD family transcriptional regulator
VKGADGALTVVTPYHFALHGRDAEREVLGDCLAATARGLGGVLLMKGPPGIGKSRLMEDARNVARRLGVRALSGRAHESWQAVPFAPLLEALFRDGGVILSDSVPTSGGSDQAFWFTHELRDALERAAADGPIAVLLDDLQWADPPTLQAVRAVSHELAGSPVLWVLAMRSGENSPLLRGTIAHLERGGARRLRVTALPPGAIKAAVTGALGAEPDDALLRLAVRAEGNPFLVVELLHGLRDEERLCVQDGRATVTGTQVPERLTQFLHDRLERMAPDTRQILRAAASLGHHCTADQITAMLRMRPFQLVEALDAAFRADLLVEEGDRLAFRHDLLREAVLDTLPRTMRRALQREAAGVLLERGAPPVEVAQQLAECAEHGDQEAIATLRAAARDLDRIDSSTAADLLVRALELLRVDDAERGALVAETVIALHRALRSDEAHELAQRALGGALAPEEEANVRLSLARLTQLRPDVRAAESEIALALPDVSVVARARHRAWLAYNRALDGHARQARDLLSAGDDTGDLEARVLARTGEAVLDLVDGSCVSALERVVAVDELIRETTWGPSPFAAVVAIHRVGLLGQLGRLEEARAAMLASIAEARRLRDARMVRVWTQVEGLLHAASGRLAEARAVFAASTDTGLDAAPGTYVGVARMLTLAQVAMHTGDAGLLRVAVPAARQVADDTSPMLRGIARWTLALAADSRGDARAAAGLFADDPLRFAMPLVPNSAACQAQMARIALAAGERALAERAAAAAERYARLNPGVPLIAGVALHTRGLVDGDPALLIEAVRVLGEAERPLLHAAAAEDAGVLLARAGPSAEAVELLDEAFNAFSSLDATTSMRRVGQQLRDLGARRRAPARRTAGSGWDALSDAELSVVRLIAGGATNRKAAEHLYLSPHTVSSHVRSAFRKLDIHSRVELAAIAAQRG